MGMSHYTLMYIRMYYMWSCIIASLRDIPLMQVLALKYQLRIRPSTSILIHTHTVYDLIDAPLE